MKATLLKLLITATTAYAQFALTIVKPSNNEFVQLGTTVPIEISASVPTGTQGPNIQISLCTQITGVSLCNGTMGRILLNAPFNPPDETYSVTIPADQTPGVTALIVGHITNVNGNPTLTDRTSISINLGAAA